MGKPDELFDVVNGTIRMPEGPAGRDRLHDLRRRIRAAVGPLVRPEAVQRAFVETKAFLYDLTLYDPHARTWRIDEFLDRGEREFGGYDQVILWQSYPRLGVDERNQFDHYRDLPGGMDAVQEWVETCHRRGVWVLLTYNPWDRHSRRGDRHLEDMRETLAVTGADGVYLDTMHAAHDGWTEALDVAFETESDPRGDDLRGVQSSWGQGYEITPPWPLYQTRWAFPEHKIFLTHHRHVPDHWDEVCAAFFTGTGVLVWENVFGNDTRWVERDKALLRAVAPILRAFWRHFTSPEWEAFVPAADDTLRVNRWPGDGGALFTIVRAGGEACDGPFIEAEPGRAYVDLVTGSELPTVNGRVAGHIGERSVAGILEVPEVTDELRALLDAACPGRLPPFSEADTRKPLAPAEPERLRRLHRYRGQRPEDVPVGMVWVPPARFTMVIDHPWHGSTCYGHDRWPDGRKTFEMPGFAIDVHPVTNAAFAAFLAATGYEPRESHNFLRHWIDGAVPPGLEEHPVVNVSLEDARAYAEWAGKRLPTEAEWQYAAQGADGRPWPWGQEPPDETRVNTSGTTAPVGSFPADASPFGAHDLCGHVWQWVDDTYADRMNRFTVLKGGAFYRLPEDAGSWYIHTGPLELTSHVKIALLSPAIDRFSTVGFRCAAD